MQKRLFHSVKITFFNKKKVSLALKNFVKNITEKHKEIEKIIVFGSFIHNKCVPGSDIDLLIILSNSNKFLIERLTYYMPKKFPVGVDIFPYTKKEIEMMLKNNNFLLKNALKEGIVIYDREKNFL